MPLSRVMNHKDAIVGAEFYLEETNTTIKVMAFRKLTQKEADSALSSFLDKPHKLKELKK